MKNQIMNFNNIQPNKTKNKEKKIGIGNPGNFLYFINKFSVIFIPTITPTIVTKPRIGPSSLVINVTNDE